MRRHGFTFLLCLLAAGLAADTESASGPVQAGHVSVIQNGRERSSVQAAPLGGLWSLSLCSDLAWSDGQDLLSFYPSGALASPAARFSPGFDVGLRRHLSDAFFVGLHLASLPKNYDLSVGGNSDTWNLDGLLLDASLGWMLYRAVSAAWYLEAGAGWLTVVNGTLDRSGAAPAQGSLQGSALSEQFGLGALWFILPSVALEAQGGWRSARVPLSLSIGGQAQAPSHGPDFYADFSGPFARLGLSFFWGLRNPWGEQDSPPPPPPPDPR